MLLRSKYSKSLCAAQKNFVLGSATQRSEHLWMMLPFSRCFQFMIMVSLDLQKFGKSVSECKEMNHSWFPASDWRQKLSNFSLSTVHVEAHLRLWTLGIDFICGEKVPFFGFPFQFQKQTSFMKDIWIFHKASISTGKEMQRAGLSWEYQK